MEKVALTRTLSVSTPRLRACTKFWRALECGSKVETYGCARWCACAHMPPNPPFAPKRALKGPGQSGVRRTMPALAPLSPQTVRHDRRYWSTEGAATSTILLSLRDADVQTPYRRQGDL